MAMFKKGYQITGREREELESIQRTAAAVNGQFVGLVQFIAKRENIDLSKMDFDASKLAFVPSKRGAPNAG